MSLIFRPQLANLLSIWIFLFSFTLSYFFQIQSRISLTSSHFFHSVTTAAVPALLVFILPRKINRYFCFCISVLLSVLTLADIINYRHFETIVPAFSIYGIFQVSDIWESIWSNIRISDFTIFLFLYLVWRLCFRFNNKKINNSLFYSSFSFIQFAIFSGLVVFVFFDILKYLESSPSKKELLTVKESIYTDGLFITHYRDLASTIREIYLERDLNSEDRIAINKFYYSKHQISTINRADATFAALKGSNLILVQIEGLQRWVIGSRFDGQELMPFLSSLRFKGFFYNSVYDQSYLSLTADSEFSVLNSLQPLDNGPAPYRLVNNDFQTLVHVFSHMGYDNFSSHAYHSYMWNRKNIHMKFGFKKSYFKNDFPPEPVVGWGLGDEEYLANNLQIIKSLEEPFFGFLITLSSHHPYNSIPFSRRKFHIAETGDFGSYLNSVNYVDNAIRGLYELLDREGILKNTTIIFYGDHDSRLRLNDDTVDYIKDSIDLEDDDLGLIGRRSIHSDKIPLIIIPPLKEGQMDVTDLITGKKSKEVLNILRSKNRVIEQVGSQIDIAPTILHLFGMRVPDSFLGMPLLSNPKFENFVARVDQSFVSQKYVYDHTSDSCSERNLENRIVPISKCRSLIKNGKFQLHVSKLVSLGNLATKIGK